MTDPPYLEAFKNTLEGGSIKPVGPGNCFQFQFSGKDKCKNKIIPLFKKYKEYLPEYKFNQFKRFYKAMDLLLAHLTKEGWSLDLTYDISKNSKELELKNFT